MALEIKTETPEPREARTTHRVEVAGYAVRWEEGEALCCFWPDWMNTQITTADIRELGVILSEIADTLEEADGK